PHPVRQRPAVPGGDHLSRLGGGGGGADRAHPGAQSVQCAHLHSRPHPDTPCPGFPGTAQGKTPRPPREATGRGVAALFPVATEGEYAVFGEVAGLVDGPVPGGLFLHGGTPLLAAHFRGATPQKSKGKQQGKGRQLMFPACHFWFSLAVTRHCRLPVSYQLPEVYSPSGLEHSGIFLERPVSLSSPAHGGS